MAITVTPTVPSLTYKTGNPLTSYVNAVVVGLSSDGQLTVVSDSIPKSAATKIAAAFKEVGATGAVDEVTRIPAGAFADAEVLVGVGLGSLSAVLVDLRRLQLRLLQKVPQKQVRFLKVLHLDRMHLPNTAQPLLKKQKRQLLQLLCSPRKLARVNTVKLCIALKCFPKALTLLVI